MQVFVDWTTLLVPAIATWAILGIHVYRCEHYRSIVDTLYFLAMILIAGLTWRTMNANESCWLIHTASLGIMIVAGVMPRKDAFDEAVNWGS